MSEAKERRSYRAVKADVNALPAKQREQIFAGTGLTGKAVSPPPGLEQLAEEWRVAARRTFGWSLAVTFVAGCVIVGLVFAVA